MTKAYHFTVRAHRYSDLSDAPHIREWQFVADSEDAAFARAYAERERVNALALEKKRARFIGVISLTPL